MSGNLLNTIELTPEAQEEGLDGFLVSKSESQEEGSLGKLLPEEDGSVDNPVLEDDDPVALPLPEDDGAGGSPDDFDEKPGVHPVLRVALGEVGTGENGRNVTKYGEWYGIQDEWCAMFISWCMAHAKPGHTRDQGVTLSVPGVAQTTKKGWAFVPFMVKNFDAVGRRVPRPQTGDIFCTNAQSHTGLVHEVEGDAFTTVEGNSSDRVERRRRAISSCIYLRPPALGGLPDVVAETFRFSHRGTMFLTDGIFARPIGSVGQNDFLARTGKYPMISGEGNGAVQDDVFSLFKVVD